MLEFLWSWEFWVIAIIIFILGIYVANKGNSIKKGIKHKTKKKRNHGDRYRDEERSNEDEEEWNSEDEEYDREYDYDYEEGYEEEYESSQEYESNREHRHRGYTNNIPLEEDGNLPPRANEDRDVAMPILGHGEHNSDVHEELIYRSVERPVERRVERPVERTIERSIERTGRIHRSKSNREHIADVQSVVDAQYKRRQNRGPPAKERKVTKRSKGEQLCKEAAERIWHPLKFVTVRPDWLRNPKTGSNLEIDLYNEELGIGIEYHGEGHYRYIPKFHRGGYQSFVEAVKRDHIKLDICDEVGVYIIVVPYFIPKDKIEEYIRQNIPID